MPDQDVQLRKILVATDFSEPAGAALRQAVLLADRARAEVTVLHVLTDVAGAVEGTSFAGHWRIPPAEIKKAEHKLRRQAEQRLAEVTAPHRSPQRKLRTETLVGVPFVEIIQAVQQKGYDLVLAGTRGRSAIKRVLVGSTAERLVRKCPCPVWVVKPRHEGPPCSILAPVDFSEVSGPSLRLAAFLANRFSSFLSALHVISSATDDVPMPAHLSKLEPGQQRRAVRRAAAQRLHDFVGSHVPVETVVKEILMVGEPWSRIGLVARSLNQDLIVMGSVGRTGIPGFLIGNTAEKVLRHCECGILTVKPDGFVSPVQPKP